MQNFILYRKKYTHEPLVFLFPYDVSFAHLPPLRNFCFCMAGIAEVTFDCNFKPQQEAFIQVEVDVKSCAIKGGVRQKDIAEVKKFVRNLIK